MDNNGIIYAVADKKLYALGFDANMTVSGENVTVFDDEIITVTIAAEGNVTITFNGESTEVPIENGTATLNVGKLAAGDYTVSVTYDGDGVTYGPAFAEATFEIIKADAEITEDECKLLLESAGVDIDEVFTEAAGSAAFNSVIAYDKKLIAVLKQYVNANAKSGAISCPSWIDLMGYKESILKPQEKSKVESDVNELKNSISNSALSTLAAGLHPQRLLDTIPGNAMNKNDFTGVINNLTRVLNDTINTIKPAVAGKAVNAGTDVIRKFDLKKQGIFNKASKSSAKVEQKELSKAEQDAANRKKGNIQRKLINSQRKFGTFS
jgi:hypothetical protein